MLWVYRITEWIFLHVLPRSTHYRVARWVAHGTLRLNAGRRRVIRENLLPLVGETRADQLAPQLLGNFLMTEVDFFCPTPKILENTHFENWEFLEKAYRTSRRVMILTAHMGHWELGAGYLANKGYPVAGLYATYREDTVVRWIHRHRDPRVTWIPTASNALDSCLKALERGQVLCMVGDIPFKEKGRRVQIAGHFARLPLGPWWIALQAGATVVPGMMLRESPGHYRATLHEPIQPKGGPLRRQMEQMQDRYARLLESYLRRVPEQWGCLMPFWEPS